MSEPRMSMENRLVPGRECGTCNVCCVALTINDKALKKVQGYRCPNTLPDKSCAIYAARPDTCRTFFCGWRLLKWVREPMRPDQSGVLVGLQIDAATGRHGVVFTLLTSAALRADGLAESVAAAVAADVPIWLQIPGPPGYTSSQARMNDALHEAVITMDKPGLLRILRQARAVGRAGETVPIVLRDDESGGPSVPATDG